MFPVTEIDGRKIGDGCVGPKTKWVIQKYEKILTEGKRGTPVYKKSE